MRRFTQLFFELDATNRTNEKVAALHRYFSEAPPRDAAWGLFFLSGARIARAVNTPLLRMWVSEETEIAPWLVDECYAAVGDLAEALALLLPENPNGTDEPLHVVAEQRIMRIAAVPESEKRKIVVETWAAMDSSQRLVWHKLISGAWRVGVARTLVVRALAGVAGIEPGIMAHRLMGTWRPTEEDYLRLMSGETVTADPSQPYPFYLAYPMDFDPAELGDVHEFQAEWKWDGIRSQFIHRGEHVLIWSRGEDLITDRFPEIAAIGPLLPDGTVLDGEIVAWRDNRPGPFQHLQRRITRKVVDNKIMREVPVAFLAYDIMEANGEDIRHTSMDQRRAMLEEIAAGLGENDIFHLSPVQAAEGWSDLARLRETSRENYAEGLMLKRRSAPYGVGRVRGDWWKWKIDPYTLDAVLIYAQRGSGKRAELYTDYTFGVWHEGELVTIAKAYSGLTDREIREVDAFIRRNTLERWGPVRQVKPVLVFELGFEGLQHSTRNKSKIAVRFPRILRWRQDKPAEEADDLETVRRMLDVAEAGK